MDDFKIKWVVADLFTDELQMLNAAEFMLAMLLVNGVKTKVLVRIARELPLPRSSPISKTEIGEEGGETEGADFVRCLANGTGENLPLLRSQALDELRSEFPTVFKFLEENNGSSRVIRVPVFGRN